MRIKAIYKPSDFPAGDPDVTDADVSELFGYLFPGVSDPVIDENHAGTAITAHNPQLALQLAKLSRFMALDLGWSKRSDLRELAFATLNLRLDCTYAFESRLAAAKACGLSAEQLAVLPLWERSTLFDDEQKLVIEYTLAVVDAEVPGELFARVVERFGEKGAVEFTSVIAVWSAWAMILNAIRP